MKKIKAGVLGAPGNSGEELVRLLAWHPHVELTYVAGKEERNDKIQDLFPYLKGRVDLACRSIQPDEAIRKCDVLFTALPHTASMDVVPHFLKAGKKVVDVSADYRLKNTAQFEKHYKAGHKDPVNLRSAVYGLTELYRSKISRARLVANPGCYPTSALLALAPGLKKGLFDSSSIQIDAKSGVTGAGRKADKSLIFSEVNESFKAYKLFEHQHTPEIEQELSRIAGKNVNAVFVPHLLPINRGILSTIYVRLLKAVTTDELVGVYRKFYHGEYFVRVYEKGALPEIKTVARTNFCDIGMKTLPERNLAVLVCVIDNLGKGAAGQAVQNMNVMYGLPEKAGF